MKNAIQEMLEKYEVNGLSDRKNALKEILQEIVLCGLSHAGFFKKAAFYGGTALRVFYGLDRFSEDLDFSLTIPDESFDLSEFFPALREDISSFGLDVKITEREKTKESDIQSAFLKGNTKEHMLMFFNPDREIESIPGNELIKIKFEVDTNPPSYASFERKYRLLPSPYEIMLYDLPSLFAGKVHAVICRAWRNRVKGRDLYDYLFYMVKGATLNIEHLKARLVQSETWKEEDPFNIIEVKRLLCERFDSINYQQAKSDVLPFVKDPSSLELWSAEFFKGITESIKFKSTSY
ncbi:MAG: nucleotidyl transferase AbiEii/AbiGii toxin family protein [Spirochaetales bacterium]|nr:nucleotidyl transferase AbiEii/AbiGii toxin family protein [Spirochaetales bacterium]